MFRTNQERANAIKALGEYVDSLPDGEELPWIRIEADTNVKMNANGKDMFRYALSLRKRPYSAIRGIGIRLSCADSAMDIAKDKLVKIDQSVRRADKTTHQLQDRHFAQMPAAKQQQMLMLTSFFGAIRSIAKNATQKVFAPASSEQK